jgi:hypothetical protein
MTTAMNNNLLHDDDEPLFSIEASSSTTPFPTDSHTNGNMSNAGGDDDIEQFEPSSSFEDLGMNAAPGIDSSEYTPLTPLLTTFQKKSIII